MVSKAIVWHVALLFALTTQGAEPITLKGHGGWIGAVAFSPDGSQLAIGTGDGSVSLWDVARRTKMHSLQGHADAVAALAFSADGAWLASGGHDGVARMHGAHREVKPADPDGPLRGHTGAVLSLTFANDGKRLFTGGIDGTIRDWDTKSRQVGKILRDHSSWVNALAVDSATGLLASASSDNTIQVRRLKDLELLHTFQVKEGEIRAAAFSPDGKWLAAGIRYGGVRVWDVKAKKEVASLKAHVGESWAVAFTPDGKMLATGGGDWNKPGEVRLWDANTWKERATLAHTGEVLCLAMSRDGNLLAAGSWDRTVRIWHLDRLPERPGR